MSLPRDNEIDKLSNKIRNLENQRVILILAVLLLGACNIVIFLWHSQVTSILRFLASKCTVAWDQLYLLFSKAYLWFVFQVPHFTKIFNNREMALGIWLLVFMVYLLGSNKMRPEVGNLVKVVLDKKFVVLYICMIIYTSFVVYILSLTGFWEESLLKDTIIWFLFTGIVSAFKAIDKAEDITYFKKVVIDNFKIVLVFEFIVNFYTFNLIGELILIPIVVVITLLKTILDTSPEFQNKKSEPAKKLFGFINVLVGIYIVINSVVLAIKDFKNFGTIATLKNILLPSILSTAFIVFVFFFALWSGYEQIFIRIRFGEKKSKRLIAYTKLKVFLLCHLNFNRVKSFWKTSGLRILNSTSKTDVLEAINSYKEQEKIKRSGMMLED